MICKWRKTVQLRKNFRKELRTQDKKAFLEQRLMDFVRTKYTAICFFHWRELFKYCQLHGPIEDIDKVD